MKFFIKDYSSKYDQIRIFLCSDQCTEKYHVLEVRNVGSTGNDCTKWMNTIKIHKTKLDGGFSYNVCYYKKWYRNTEFFIKSNLQLNFVSYELPTYQNTKNWKYGESL